MTSTLRAYHGAVRLKNQALARIAAHRQADRIIQGLYWEEDEGGVFRGCAVGCLLEDPEGGHERYETEFGVPEQLAWLEDSIFEALPAEIARDWPHRFMSAIPVGADLATVWPRFAIWLMVDPTYGLEHVTEADDVKDVCRRVADGYRQILAGGISDEDAQKITDAARAARAARDAFVAASADRLIQLLAASTETGQGKPDGEASIPAAFTNSGCTCAADMRPDEPIVVHTAQCPIHGATSAETNE